MVTAKMEALHAKLDLMAPPGAETKRLKAYITFKVDAPKGARNAVTIRSQGASFFIEDTLLLEGLAKRELKWHKLGPGKGSTRLKYRFTNLTPGMLDKHSEDLRRLFEESVKLNCFIRSCNRKPPKDQTCQT